MPFYYKDLGTPANIDIPGGLKVGHTITVYGKVSDTEERFSINLMRNSTSGSDIAFHFNPRVNQNTVVRNTRVNGSWQNEELDVPNFPFTNGQLFTVEIIVTQDKYVVLVNSVFYLEYNHRIGFQEMTCLNLNPSAEYHEVWIREKCRVPYHLALDELKNGMAVSVRGMVNEDAHRFTVNFNCDEAGNNIALHFNPRQDQQDTVCNTKINGSWGTEERGFPGFPFGQGKFFAVNFQIHDGHFVISNKGEHIHDYAFRVPLDQIKYLDVHGDIALMEVHVCEESLNEYVFPIHGGLQLDDMISVMGFFKPGQDRFDVNLLTGLSSNSERALHVNPRRGQGEVVCNNTVGGHWQTEVKFPLPASMNKKAPFFLDIINKESHYDIFINGKKLGDFPHRGVNGADIKAVYCKDDAYYHHIEHAHKLPNPLATKIVDGPAYGNWVSVIGVPTADPVRFVIESKTGSDTNETTTQDIPFHYNPRFSQNETVRNTLHNGSWGTEEKDEASFPFTADDLFEVNMLLTEANYKTVVNGENHIQYAHRVPALDISHVITRLDANFYLKEFY